MTKTMFSAVLTAVVLAQPTTAAVYTLSTGSGGPSALVAFVRRTLRKSRILASLCLALGIAAPAMAADDVGRFAVEGLGNMTCARFAHLHSENDDYIGAVGWIDGYLSAFNQFQHGTYDLTPWQTTELIANTVQSVCARHGEIKLVEAVNALAKHLAPTRMTQAEELRRLDNGTEAVFTYDRVLADIRDALVAQNLLADPTTPLTDARLLQAIGIFQQAQGIPMTGLPDLATLVRLLAN